MTAAGRYAELSSAVRCFKGELLQRHQIERLVEAGSLSETIGLLTGGHTTSVGRSDLASAEAHLTNKIFQLVKRLISYAPPDSRPLLRIFSTKFEFECAKEILKAVYYEVASGEALRHIIPAGRFTAERCSELIEARDPSGAIDALEDEALKHFISPRLMGERDGLTVVSALDQYYYSRLWAACSLRDLVDAQVARSLVGESIDHMNILLALRSQLMGLDARSISELLVPVNHHLGTAFNELADAGSLPNMIRVLDRTPYADVLKMMKVGSDDGSLEKIELALNRAHLATCLSTFAGSPFHIGLALAFLMIKNYELHDLLAILNAKANNVPSERTIKSLILWSQ